jgi:DNA polymerase-1
MEQYRATVKIQSTEVITLDFETKPIVGNPLVNPPRPVGLAVYLEGEPPYYLTDWQHMVDQWEVAMDSGEDLLFHNAPFDLSVGCHWFNTPWPDWERVHDTLYLLFFADPYAKSLGLKPSAERYLDLPPNEQDELHDWILTNVPEATKRTAGFFIHLAPVHIVTKYAIGDVIRTRQLYDKLHPETPVEAYDRERRLAPILTESSRRGIRVDNGELQADSEVYHRAILQAEQRIYRICDREFNINSGTELASALDSKGLVHTWFLTPTGKRSTSRPNLIKGIKDPDILNLLSYRSMLNTCLSTFMDPWLKFSEADGRMHPEWNQVKHGDDQYKQGARTGRLSCARPNFQNMPNEFDMVPPEGLPNLPNLRKYILPEEGHVWLKRDFSSQEIRILAHFEDGVLAEAYRGDPNLDPHQTAIDIIASITRIEYSRKDVKISGFSIVYGTGVTGLASQLGQSHDYAYNIKQAYLKAFPGIEKLAAGTSARGRAGGFIRTWGGRRYYAEPSRIVKGRWQDFHYKLLNYLIQGSAGDQTKQCINDWDDMRGPEDKFLCTVHDEINISAPEECWEESMKRLTLAMDQDLFDVPMRSEGFIGPNWYDIEKVN